MGRKVDTSTVPTPKQAKMLEYIKDYFNAYGYAPTVREIGDHLNLVSTSGVKLMIDRLRKKGLLHKKDGMARSVTFPNQGEFPILGHIRAGLPVTAEENVEGYIPLHDFLKASSGGFVLVVEGDSMKDKGIMHGDYAFIQPQNDISNGQIGAFRLNGEVTLKTYKNENGRVSLAPANEEYQPIIVYPEDTFQVIGRFVMLLRLAEKGYDRRIM